jgi:hypothetical protein
VIERSNSSLMVFHRFSITFILGRGTLSWTSHAYVDFYDGPNQNKSGSNGMVNHHSLLMQTTRTDIRLCISRCDMFRER